MSVARSLGPGRRTRACSGCAGSGRQVVRWFDGIDEAYLDRRCVECAGRGVR